MRITVMAMKISLIFFLEVGLPSRAVVISDRNVAVHVPSITRGNVVTVIRFPNIPCSSPTRQLTGICYSLQECLKMHGTQIGTCASGYGVCCIFYRTCGSATNQNLTHFINRNFPQDLTDTAEMSCTLTLLRPPRSSLCQMRLDFFEFELVRPTDGDCFADRFYVMGQNSNSLVPVICGSNAGQHVYLNVDSTFNPIVLTIHTRGEGRRKWNIRVTFIECTSPAKAPSNCLQYYTGESGRFSSFNYLINEPTVQDSGYLNQLNYAICFRKEVGRCSQTYTVPTEEYFALINLNQDNSPTVENGAAGLGVIECPTDYLRLGGDRYCGARLNPSSSGNNPTFNYPVTDFSGGPFVAQFVTDSTINAAGFRLQYVQNACYK